MKRFWAYISNGEYSVGTTGQTVYLFDKSGKELDRFKDLTYGYMPLFSPDGKIFVIKSTAGRLAVYSLESHSLIKKFRFAKDKHPQDIGMCFSPDGKYLFNLECHGEVMRSAITVYDTADFKQVHRTYTKENVILHDIEYDEETNEYYVLGLVCGDMHSAPRFFMAKYKDGTFADIKNVSEDDYELYRVYLDLKMMGFTDKAYEWSFIRCELEKLKGMDSSLAKFYKSHGK